jgi:hypothetical protein
MESVTLEIAPHILGRVTKKVIGMVSHECEGTAQMLARVWQLPNC